MARTDPLADGTPDSAWIDSGPATPPRRLTGRLDSHTGLLVLLGLAGAALLVLWWRLLAQEPSIDASFRRVPDGRVVLQASGDPALQVAVGRVLAAVVGADGQVAPPDSPVLARSSRWVVDDTARADLHARQTLLSDLLRQPQLMFQFDDGLQVRATPRARGLPGLGAVAWLMGALALALYGAAVVVLLDRPNRSTAVYAALVLGQAVNLLLTSGETLPGLGLPPLPLRTDLVARILADAVVAGSLVQVMMLYPHRLPLAARGSLPLWLGVGLLVLLLTMATPPGLWWWMQGLTLGGGLGAVMVLRQAQQRHANPLTALLLRLTAAGTGTLALLTVAVAWAQWAGLHQPVVAAVGSAVWQVFLASLLMLAPFLTRSRKVAREFAVLAGTCTVVCSLDLLFIAVLGVGQAAAITLALALSLMLYLGARHWALAQLAGAGGLSAERMFEGLYRAARALEQRPERAGEQLAILLREVFDPLELSRSSRPATRIRIAVDGSAMVVPVPQLSGGTAAGNSPTGAIVLRFAQRGRRLFTREDQQFSERLIEQLRRAAAYDRAVEQGRTEERTRIAQDLHDDIGARLLTLMYKAQNPEIEEYIRHTLQDLKTLTRGLAASNHRLSHAAAEWKSDITQRLAATGCDLRWSFSCDRDFNLTVVQWSGITRVLRELVNNIIAHARATQVDVVLVVDQRRLQLSVSDDGCGQAPERWSHGLGLGGVRKRVKLLGGQVVWRERSPHGIRCEVQANLAADPG